MTCLLACSTAPNAGPGASAGSAAAANAGIQGSSAGTAAHAGTSGGNAAQAGIGVQPSAGSAANAAAGRGTAGAAAGGGTAAGGTAGSAGASVAGATAGRGAGNGGAAATAGAGAARCAEGAGKTEHFSFFVTSLAGMRRLAKSENGFGGDLRFGKADGLSGADEICRQLAEDSSPGAGCKTWRALLSVTKGPDGKPVHAKDRIGNGPWYDRRGRLVAMTKANLLSTWPVGADPAIAEDLPNEFGVPNHDPDLTGRVDNHNTLTGTNAKGELAKTDWQSTCHDWTSKVGEDGEPIIGFSWRGGAATFEGNGWFFGQFTEGGCAPIINLTDAMDFSIRGVGARGGYGGIYCLALEP